MISHQVSYEVEVRFHFSDSDHAYRTLPFIRSCLEHQSSWTTTFYGLKLFQSGQLLRTSEVVVDEGTKYYLGWKGPDIGEFANIRQELDEDITSVTAGSSILEFLGGNKNVGGIQRVIQELERLGYHRFMLFEGTDLTGYYEPYDIGVKLMTCMTLKWPFLVELEKTANTKEEATRCETELYELSHRFQLQSRLVREEPPSLLYAGLFAD